MSDRPVAKTRGAAPPSIRNILRLGVGVAVVVLVVWLLAANLDWQAVVEALAEADYRWVGLGVAAILGTFLTRGRRWQALLYRDDVSLRSAVTALLVGQVINTGLPVMRSGDVTRAVWANRHDAVGVTPALGSIALEKLWDLIALCATGVVMLVMVPLPDWFVRSTWGVILISGLALVVLHLGLHWQRPLLDFTARVLQRLSGKLGRLAMPQLRQLVAALDAVRQPQASLWAGVWTMGTWALGAAANWAVMRAFGVDSVLGATFLLATSMLGGAVVPTPGRVGVFEGICVASLVLFGVDASLALAIGLVLHVVVVGPSFVGAAILAVLNATSDRSSASD